MRSSYRWVVFLFIYMAFMTQYVVYLSWNPFVPLAANVFAFSMGQCSVIVAAVAFGRLLFQLPGGMLVDRFSAKRLLLLSLSALGCCVLIGAGGKGSFQSILLSQFLIGMMGVMVWPLCIKVIVEYFPSSEQDFVCGLLNTGATIAVMITNVYVPYAVKELHWEFAFIGIALLCLFNILILAFFMKDKPQKEMKVSLDESKKTKKSPISRKAIGELLKNKGFILCLVSYAGALYTSWGVNTWVTTYLLHGAGVDAGTVSKMMLVFGLTGCFSLPLTGVVTRGSKKGRYCFLLIDLFCLGTLLLCLPLIHTEALLWVFVVLLGIASFAHMGPLNLVAVDFINRNILGTAMALSIFVWQITAMLQSAMIGRALDLMPGLSGYQWMFLILAAGAYAACVAIAAILYGLKHGKLHFSA